MRALGLVLLIVVLLVGWRALSANQLTSTTQPERTTSQSNGDSNQTRQEPVQVPTSTIPAQEPPDIEDTRSETRVRLGDGEYGLTGDQIKKKLGVRLDPGEAVVGQSYGFQGEDTSCRAWLISGPFEGIVYVTSGEWFAFLGVDLSRDQQLDLLEQVAQKQRDQGYGCTTRNQHIDRIGG